MFKIRILYTLCLLMLFTANLFAEWNNYVTNYKKELFGKGSQTWQINAFNENWVYFADSAHAPYGEKSIEYVIARAQAIDRKSVV